MIAGIGTDIVSVARIDRLIGRYGDRLATRILSDVEYEEYKQSGQSAAFLAKRFAAKEATVKALGTGFRMGVVKRDIIVTHDALGKPLLVFAGVARLTCERMRIRQSWLSLSDEKQYAMAFVILETD